MSKGYCLKCKTKVEMKDEKEELTKNNRKLLRGICPVCNTKIAVFLKKE